ncbi:MAG: universal stress protein [Thermodesulfobacteriota bacterium]
MKINKILWATDGSKVSHDAFNWARLFAKTFGAEITGIHVLKPIEKKIYEIAGRKLDVKSLMEKESADWSNQFDEIYRVLKKEKLRFKHSVMEHYKPYEKIIQVADQENASLIVMGKRGLGLKDKTSVGSNTLRVLQGSRVPVLAVKGKTTKILPKIKKILVPLDISEKFSTALDYALSLGEHLGAAVTVIYVEQLVSYPYEFPITILNEMRDMYDNQLKKRVEEISRQFENKLRIKHKVVEAITPFLGIIRFAEGEKSDLIVMNTHGRKGLKKLFLGSVAEKVIYESPCSILALRP